MIACFLQLLLHKTVLTVNIRLRTSNVFQAFALVVHFVICPNLGHKLKVHTHTFHSLVIYKVSNYFRYMFAFRVAAVHPWLVFCAIRIREYAFFFIFICILV